jgi:hypothetical protein
MRCNAGTNCNTAGLALSLPPVYSHEPGAPAQQHLLAGDAINYTLGLGENVRISSQVSFYVKLNFTTGQNFEESFFFFFLPDLRSGQYMALSQVCLLVTISRFKELMLSRVN